MCPVNYVSATLTPVALAPDQNPTFNRDLTMTNGLSFSPCRALDARGLWILGSLDDAVASVLVKAGRGSFVR
jgi:hypothetical protein